MLSPSRLNDIFSSSYSCNYHKRLYDISAKVNRLTDKDSVRLGCDTLSSTTANTATKRHIPYLSPPTRHCEKLSSPTLTSYLGQNQYTSCREILLSFKTTYTLPSTTIISRISLFKTCYNFRSYWPLKALNT